MFSESCLCYTLHNGMKTQVLIPIILGFIHKLPRTLELISWKYPREEMHQSFWKILFFLSTFSHKFNMDFVCIYGSWAFTCRQSMFNSILEFRLMLFIIFHVVENFSETKQFSPNKFQILRINFFQVIQNHYLLKFLVSFLCSHSIFL